MKPYQVKINPNKVAKEIANDIRSGRYKCIEFKEIMSALQDVAIRLTNNEEISTSDIIVLKLYGYLPHK